MPAALAVGWSRFALLRWAVITMYYCYVYSCSWHTHTLTHTQHIRTRHDTTRHDTAQLKMAPAGRGYVVDTVGKMHVSRHAC